MNKGLLLSSLILVVLIAIVVQAGLDITQTPAQLSRSVNSTTFNVKNSEAGSLDLTLSVSDIISPTDSTSKIHYTITPSTKTLAAGNETTFKIAYDSIPDGFDLGTFTKSILISGSNSTTTINNTQEIQLYNGWCDSGAKGNLKITSISDTSDNDWEWHPLDELDLDVDIKNDNSDSLGITVQADLYDTINNNFIGLDINGKQLEDSVNIDEKSSETVTFKVKVPTEAQADSSRYILYVKAFEDGSEEDKCTETSKIINLKRDSREIKFESITVPESVSCGDTATINVDVANIGKNDENKVKVTMRNSELGISQSIETAKIKKTDNPKTQSFSFIVPQNAKEKLYTLSFDISYNYDKTDTTYGTTVNNFATANLKVLGNCVPSKQTNVSVSTSLDSSAKAGSEMTIKLNIVNTGNTETQYSVSLSGYEDWASNAKVNPSTVSVRAGETSQVLVYLTPNKDVSGDKNFTIKTSFDSKTTEQKVNIAIEKAGFSLGIGGNWYIWVIVAVNVVLILVIIIVAIAMSRR